MKHGTACRIARKSPQSFLDCLRHFLTPQAWKQAQQHCPKQHGAERWTLHTLVFTLLVLTWCCGDSLPERFETARAFHVVCHPKRKRPGQTFAGFQKALARLPMPALRVLAASVRQRLEHCFADCWQWRGFVPIGCDGSRVPCPRSAELEQRLGQAGKDESAPMIWVTALVHLRTGLLWAWRLGKGTASELAHLKQMIGLLPRLALVVADAGYLDYDLYATLLLAKRSFLIRMSSRAYLYVSKEVPLTRFREGLVYYWPHQAQQRNQAPLELRLLRIKGRKHDVWLLTDVLDKKRLSRKTASQLYRWRWRNEGLFRTYKRTVGKLKLSSRTIKQVHREAEGSLLAVQLLLAQGTQAVRSGAGEVEILCSARSVLVAIRAEIVRLLGQELGPRQWRDYQQRLQQAQVEQRQRRSAKERRPWPRRKPHKPPKAPKFRVLTKAQKAKIAKELRKKKRQVS